MRKISEPRFGCGRAGASLVTVDQPATEQVAGGKTALTARLWDLDSGKELRAPASVQRPIRRPAEEFEPLLGQRTRRFGQDPLIGLESSCHTGDASSAPAISSIQPPAERAWFLT
jgi:hypothetical protein